VIRRRTTVVLSSLLAVVGGVILIQGAVLGSPLGVLVGALLALLGAGRVVLATRR
jgi:hypothetical protein